MVENSSKQININLLPQEIIDKRRGEQRLIYALFAAIVIVGVFVIYYSVNMIRISTQARIVNDLKRENAKYAVAINQVKSYQEKQSQLEKREKLIDSVSDFDFSWAKFLNDVSLIIPNDVWLSKIDGDEKLITFEGMSKSTSDEEADIGHKLVAKWLVHLDEINTLTDVWLVSSEKLKDKNSGKIKFVTNAKIKQKKKVVKAPAVPAPPPVGNNNQGAAQ